MKINVISWHLYTGTGNDNFLNKSFKIGLCTRIYVHNLSDSLLSLRITSIFYIAGLKFYINIQMVSSTYMLLLSVRFWAVPVSIEKIKNVHREPIYHQICQTILFHLPRRIKRAHTLWQTRTARQPCWHSQIKHEGSSDPSKISPILPRLNLRPLISAICSFWLRILVLLL